MRKKKKLLNLILLLSLGTGTFTANLNAVFAQAPADEIIVENDENKAAEVQTEISEDAEPEIELNEKDTERNKEQSSSPVNFQSDYNEEETDLSLSVENKQDDDIELQENGSANQSAFFSSTDFEIKDGVLVKYRGFDSNVVIPNSVTSIGDNAFSQSSIKNVTIPDSVGSIGMTAFLYSSIESITIPDSVQSIGGSAFYGCRNLQKITIGNGLKEIPNWFAYGCTSLKTVNIGKNVETIGNSAFYNCRSLSSINFPDSLKSIYTFAFSYSGLVDVIIPDSVTELSDTVFNGCENLQTIHIGDGVTSIKEFFASDCPKLRKVTFGNNVSIIKWSAFKDCASLSSITFPDSVTQIEGRAFYNASSLESVRLPENLESIGQQAFDSAGLKSVTIPDRTVTIGVSAFANMTSLTDVYLPMTISFMDSEAFSNSPNVCLHTFLEHDYAIEYARKHNIRWQSRGQYYIAKPQVIKAESVGKNKVRLSWSKASGADKYLVQCWRNGKLQYKYTTKNNYLTDPKASDTTSNTYKVYSRMTRSDGTIVYSSQPAVVSGLGICPRVTNVRANSSMAGGQIKWNKSYYNDGYIIYRSVNKNGTGAVYAGTTRDVKFIDKKAKKGQLYYYWVYPYHYKNGKMILGEKPVESPKAKMK